MNNFLNRIFRALKLDIGLYEEVEADAGSINQATLIVILSSIAAGLGSISKGGLLGTLMGTINALVGWYLWAFFAYLFGAKLFPGPQTKTNIVKLLRTISFSCAPGFIMIFGIIPNIEEVVFSVATIWMMAAMVLAVKQVLHYDGMMRAISVCIISWFAKTLILLTIFNIIYKLSK